MKKLQLTTDSYPQFRRCIITLALGCMSAFFCSLTTAADSQLPYYNSPDFTPHWFDPMSEELLGFHRIPSFSFTDQEGRNVTDRTIQKKIYVASFFFTTCPGICPTIRSKLSRVQDEYRDDDEVRILSHSIQPTIDTVEILKDYAERNDIRSDNWHLLTGDKRDIYSIAKSAYFASEDLGLEEAENDFLHTENLLLIDQNRQIRGIYNGLNNTSVSHLITDIQILKDERADLLD
ncbi:SCO family protein [Congregibacter variabilis]|uniref:SCO family protein n=1 Tax=Congregibacter variabilis TaxID=3081200 RepID=A0ABZ0I143_9GAMM|nr:SCO family protein [Congregibacter sp. IMCC43200]